MYTPNIQDIKTSFDEALPTTYDYLKPNGFRFSINYLPHVSYTCQSVTLPSIGFGATRHETPMLDYYVAGEKVIFGDLSLSFIVSEDMSNYRQLFDWMTSIGDPVDYEKYNEFVTKKVQNYPGTRIDRPNSDSVKYSDASLIILTASNNPNINIKFKRLFPISLTGIQFDTTVSDIQYFTCEATFKYEMFEIEVL